MSQSFPVYPNKHSGPVLVCGNAWCLVEDVVAARKIKRLEKAPVIGVNGSSWNIQLDFLFTQSHPTKMAKWRGRQELTFHKDFTTHCGGDGKAAHKYPAIDYWWTGVSGQGTSTWAARKFACYLGFSEVVLCGMPLEVGGYQSGREFAKHFYSQEMINFYRHGVEADIDWHGGCHSMSGWTRDLLGAPDAN